MFRAMLPYLLAQAYSVQQLVDALRVKLGEGRIVILSNDETVQSNLHPHVWRQDTPTPDTSTEEEPIQPDPRPRTTPNGANPQVAQ